MEGFSSEAAATLIYPAVLLAEILSATLAAAKSKANST